MILPAGKAIVGLTLLSFGLVAGGCARAVEPPVDLKGVGEGQSDDFTVSSGYYSIGRTVASSSPLPCYFSARVETPDGQLVHVVDGPAVSADGTAEYVTDGYWLGNGQYRLAVFSGCGNWEVEIARQKLFDEESKAKATGRPANIYPEFSDPQQLREMPPPVATAAPQPSPPPAPLAPDS